MKKTSYQYLQEFSQIKSRSSFNRESNPKTPRVNYILEQLQALEVEIQEDDFFVYPDALYKYINIYAKFSASNPEITDTILFVAHHDISNPNSENCQDNSASVCNLLELCSILKGKELNKNIIICFTDGEEPASVTISGAGKIAKMCRDKQAPFENVKYAINLELTGAGRIIWADFFTAKFQFKESKLIGIINDTIENVFPVSTPYSDSYAFRYFGVDSVCIGCFNDIDVAAFSNRNYPPTWALCHKMEDTIDKISEEDMKYFVNEILTKFID